MPRQGFSVRIDPAEVGRALAHEGDEEQAAALNSMAAELVVCCRTPRDLETQHCYISAKLDRSGREFIKSLAEFVRLREETEKP